jgi:hypothetical protein
MNNQIKEFRHRGDWFVMEMFRGEATVWRVEMIEDMEDDKHTAETRRAVIINEAGNGKQLIDGSQHRRLQILHKAFVCALTARNAVSKLNPSVSRRL